MADITSAALALADHGFGVFPVWSARDGVCRCPKAEDCPSPAKHPITGDGFKSATTDPERITTFLSNNSKPNYGVVAPDGVFVLDVDGPDVARFERLAEEYGPLPDTFKVATRNGYHIYLRWPANEPRPDHRMFGLVTRWGDGRGQGYTLGPGSVHATGFVYEVVSELPPAMLPPKWVEAAKSKPVEFIIGGSEAELPAAGGRHDWLVNRSRFYAGSIRDESVLVATLLAENQRLPEPIPEPRASDEIRSIAKSALEKFGPDPEARYIEAANFQRAGMGYRMSDVFNSHTVMLEAQSVRERKGSLHAELTVTVDGDEVSRSDEPVSDAVRAARLADALEALKPIGVYWASVLEGFYRRVREEEYRADESYVKLGHLPGTPSVEYVLEPLCIREVATILFAKEGTGKSTLAAAIGVSVATGQPVYEGWSVPEPGGVLVLDWETTKHDWDAAVKYLCAGAGIPVPDNLHYRKMAKALTKDIESVQRFIQREAIRLVIVDSVMMASPQGSGEAADSALELFRGLRELDTTSLLIDHLNKQTPSGEGSRPYGSVYKPALARATFELYEREAPAGLQLEFGAQHLTLAHRKANLTMRMPEVNIRIERMGEATRIVTDDVLFTKDVQYRNLKRAVSNKPGLLPDVAARSNIDKERAERMLEWFPEFQKDTNGLWTYVAEASDE